MLLSPGIPTAILIYTSLLNDPSSTGIYRHSSKSFFLIQSSVHDHDYTLQYSSRVHPGKMRNQEMR